MRETTQKRVRFRRVVLTTTVLVSLFILMVGLALAAWFEREDSISQSPSMVSAYADVAASGIGQEYVAVVWSEGSTGHAGALKLRWGPPGENWKWPITTIETTGSQEPSVAVSGDTAYIAYTKQSGSNWVIAYAECQYGSPCVADTVHTSPDEVGAVDIAFCGTTRHVVWWANDGDFDDIRYSHSGDGTNWDASPQLVSADEKDDTSPSIACYGDTAHVAWIEGGQYVRYKNNSSGSWSGSGPTWNAADEHTPYNTSIAAYGDYVDVVWDFKHTSGVYYVWHWRDNLGDGACSGGIPDAGTYYASTDSGTEYVRYLQPAIAVYSDTTKPQPVPAVVWHAAINSFYEVMYSNGLSFAGACVTWSPPISLTGEFPGTFGQDFSAPSIAVGISDTVTHTHVVFQYYVGAGGLPWGIYYLNDFGGPLTDPEPEHSGIYLPIIMKNHS